MAPNKTDQTPQAGATSTPPGPVQSPTQVEPRPVRSLAASILAGALASLAANFDKLDPTA